jgi:predicted metal-dependent peptidase
MPRRRAAARDLAAENFTQGMALLAQHPLFAGLYYGAAIVRHEGSQCPADGWAVVTAGGQIHVHPTRRGAPEEWTYVVAHCLLHLGFGHLRGRPREREWNAACDWFIARFLALLKLGRPPEELRGAAEPPAATEERLYELFCERGLPAPLPAAGTAGAHAADMRPAPPQTAEQVARWQARLADGLAAAVSSAVDVAGGRIATLAAEPERRTAAQRARAWFIASYPLFGALAATFTLIEDPLICHRMQIAVAAIDVESREIYFNPAAFDPVAEAAEPAYRFVMAHELLHAALRHDARREGRDPYLWNVACDYAINGWLVEMAVGELPGMGVLYDPALKGESAESIYDRIVTDLRRYRKLRTMRGIGASDILEPRTPDWWRVGEGVALDEFYRSCLAQGLAYHQQQGRGLLPAGLVEEINALGQSPIPWDVRLAHWFDEHFPPLEQRRSYAHPSRHQAATPDIPRPRWVAPEELRAARTYGVVLDTSGSMDRKLLAKALGTIASYSIARDVPAVRVVFCDAAAYDQGYMAPEEVAERVRVRGRGGTVLQPGVDLLERAEDFPPDGPLLIITDGYCDTFRVRREHAFVLPRGHSLPFVPRGPVFYVE